MKTIKEKHQFVVDNYKTMSNQEFAEKLGYSIANVNYPHTKKMCGLPAQRIA